MKIKGYLFFTLFLLAISIGCNKTWENPNSSIPSAPISIVGILATPNVYDSAGVRVTGMVWDLALGDLTVTKSGYLENISYSIFKLSDKHGNFVNVYTDKKYELEEGDIVEVTGIYRRNFRAEKRHFINEIEAVDIKLKKSLKERFSKQSSS